MHAYFALGLAAGRYTFIQMEQRLRAYGVHVAVDAMELRFCDWLQEKWLDAKVRTEVLTEWQTPGGQVLAGQIDVLLETAAAGSSPTT